MTRRKMVYVELKTAFQHNGPAWIGLASFSKTGRTLYFNGKALRRSGSRGREGNHFAIETGEEYWVSGVKKAGTDRHWAGSGKIMIDARIVDEYLALVGRDQLDTSKLEICTNIVDTDPERFRQMENEPL